MSILSLPYLYFLLNLYFSFAPSFIRFSLFFFPFISLLEKLPKRYLVGLLELCLDGLDALGELVQDLEGGLRRQQPSANILLKVQGYAGLET